MQLTLLWCAGQPLTAKRTQNEMPSNVQIENPWFRSTATGACDYWSQQMPFDKCLSVPLWQLLDLDCKTGTECIGSTGSHVVP